MKQILPALLLIAFANALLSAQPRSSTPNVTAVPAIVTEKSQTIAQERDIFYSKGLAKLNAGDYNIARAYFTLALLWLEHSPR